MARGKRRSPHAPRHVFVLGAGFTKAFFPLAPLMVDDYDAEQLARDFKPFRNASRILDLERSRDRSGLINIERLLTRVADTLPHDTHEGSREELGLLQHALMSIFREKINVAREDQNSQGLLRTFAAYCLEHSVACITLNYDDTLDEALYFALSPASKFWHPDGGYGFFCQSSASCVEPITPEMDFRLTTRLLKLHGSMNWFARRGSPQPYAVDAITHHETWSDSTSDTLVRQAISVHIEAEPLIVPPILSKSAVMEHQVLRVVWEQAYEKLRQATAVTIVGYSLPVTDLPVRTLLEEGVHGMGYPLNIHVVNKADSEPEERRLRETYRELFPSLPDDYFLLSGALDWVKSLSV